MTEGKNGAATEPPECGSSYTETRTKRDRLLEMAIAARQISDVSGRRMCVKGLVHERIRSAVSDWSEPELCCSEADLFAAAYGDDTGRDYWEAWLFACKLISDLSDLLAVHLGKSSTDKVYKEREISEVVSRVGFTTAHAAVEWLLRDPNTRHLVPDTLQAFLSQEPQVGESNSAAKPASSKSPAAAKTSRKRGGRFDWEPAQLKVSPELHAHGLPQPGDGRQAVLERLVRDTFSPGSCPSESRIREKVTEIIAAHRLKLNEGQ